MHPRTHAGGTMDDRSEPVDFQFVVRSAEDQESDARLLPTLELDARAGDSWQEHGTPFGLRLRLPVGFTSMASEDTDQAAWQGYDGSIVVVMVHDGAGDYFLFHDAGTAPVEPHDEGTYQIPIADRAGTLNLSRVSAGQQDRYCAFASAGIRTGLGVAVFVSAATQALRASLLNIIPTIVAGS